jgi:phosphoglycerate dehydrogenase-like enzyme
VWIDFDRVDELERVLEENSGIEWVQLPWAGVERFAHLFDSRRTWTSAKGVFGPAVAELALGLLLGGMRHIVAYSRLSYWSEDHGVNLVGANVVIVGGGGIATSLTAMLKPFGCHVTVVRNRVQEMADVHVVVGHDDLDSVLPGADAVVLALALTEETAGMFSRTQFELMERHAWIVNVARGRHIVTDDLVWALRTGEIGGAALDVTDPEPLPEGHPLWSMHNCFITPHVGNTADMVPALLSVRITDNVRRLARGEALEGLIDVELGY